MALETFLCFVSSYSNPLLWSAQRCPAERRTSWVNFCASRSRKLLLVFTVSAEMQIVRYCFTLKIQVTSYLAYFWLISLTNCLITKSEVCPGANTGPCGGFLVACLQKEMASRTRRWRYISQICQSRRHARKSSHSVCPMLKNFHKNVNTNQHAFSS